MEGSYPVLLGEETVGRVHVRREGLYYRFDCRCRLTGEIVYKVVVLCGGLEESLGVCVPMGDGFGLDTRVPVKHLGQGEPRFEAKPRHEKTAGRFVPIYPEEPFAYISKLKDAFLAKRGEQLGAVLPE